MKIIAVDSERKALDDLKHAIEGAMPGARAACFDTPFKALRYAAENFVEIAFLDISPGEMNGLELARRLKNINRKTNIVFVTGYARYAVDAFSVQASDYLLKPVTKEAVAAALERLREPVARGGGPRVRVVTFGNFEVFADGEPLAFARTKTRELLAYLVSRRGVFCTNDEIIAVLWEDKADTLSLKSHFRHLVSDLTHTLRCAGADGMLIKKRGRLAVAPAAFQCDLYDYCDGEPAAISRYNGEFMAQYDWAEYYNAYLYRTAGYASERRMSM